MSDEQRSYLQHSQNFLTSRRLVRALLNSTTIAATDVVVEIGPGKGIITRELQTRAAKVFAIELDHRYAQSLKEAFASQKNVQIIEHDFLTWPLPEVAYKIFANPPFNLTSAIMRKLLLTSNPPQAAYVLLQSDAAMKYCTDSRRSVSQLAVLFYPFFSISPLVPIRRHNFYPRPHVDATLLGIVKRPEPLVSLLQRPLYTDFIVYGFNQWQPTVAAAYRAVFTPDELRILDAALSIAHIRPSRLPADSWLQLFNFFIERTTPQRQLLVQGAEANLQRKQSTMVKRHRRRIS